MMYSHRFSGAMGGGSGGDYTQTGFSWGNLTGFSTTNTAQTFDETNAAVEVWATMTNVNAVNAGGNLIAYVNGVAQSAEAIMENSVVVALCQPGDTLKYGVTGGNGPTPTLTFDIDVTNASDGGAALGSTFSFTL